VRLFTEDPEDEWVTDTLSFYRGIFISNLVVFRIFILIYPSNMPALTRRAKRRLIESLEDEEGSGDEVRVGILAQRAARRQAAREAEGPGEQRHQVCLSIYFSHQSFIPGRLP
jgi:hypothetical protein